MASYQRCKVGMGMKSTSFFRSFLLMLCILQFQRFVLADTPTRISHLPAKSLIPFPSSVIEDLVKIVDPQATIQPTLGELGLNVQIRGKSFCLELDRITLDIVTGEIDGMDGDERINALARIINGNFQSVNYENRRMIF